MKTKQLLLLVLIAVALGLLAYVKSQSRNQRAPAQIGAKVFPGLDVNTISRINLITADGTSTVAKAKETWVVVDRYQYPAKFSKVKEMLLELKDLTIGQVATAGDAQLGKLKLLPPGSGAASNATGQTGTRLLLLGSDGLEVGSLLIGKNFMRQPPGGGGEDAMGMGMFGGGGYPDGQYVRLSDGKVVVVGKTLDRLMEDIKTWLDEEFVAVPSLDLETMDVEGPDRAPIRIARGKDPNSFAVEGVKDSETTDTAKLNQLTGGLNYLGFDDVADPALKPTDTGLDQPVRIVAKTKQGRHYTLSIGKTISTNSTDRYAQIHVTYAAPTADTNAPTAGDTNATARAAADAATREKTEADVKALDAKLAAWTYTLKSYRLDPLLVKREDLVKPKSPETNAPPATAESAPAAVSPAVPAPVAAPAVTVPAATPAKAPATAVPGTVPGTAPAAANPATIPATESTPAAKPEAAAPAPASAPEAKDAKPEAPARTE